VLTKLLHRFASGHMPSVTELSQELDIDTGMVLQMLMDLERLGYVERPATDASSCRLRCGSGCCGCSTGRELASPQQAWQLTEKGQRRIENGRTGTREEGGS
jgi:predicted ArsR family transcriptional regulator